MELRIKPFPKNNYPKKGLLIKSSSPWNCFHEMDVLGIDLNQIQSFAIPSNEPNVLYGCLLIFDHAVPKEIGKNAYFQCVDDKLFIPENTTFYPKVNPEDWQSVDTEFLIMHPEFGLVKLSEKIDWNSLLEDPELSDISIRKPLNGVKIPRKIESYTVEMDDEKVMEFLQKPQTEEEWMKNLPFDLKKVMAGNKKEIEKYLLYIEKYPDRAVDLGVPLDIMGTSRGDGFGKFSFDKGWLGKLFGKDPSDEKESAASGNYRWVFWAVLLIIAIARFSFKSNKDENSKTETSRSAGNIMSDKELADKMAQTMAFESGLTEIDMKIDSLYSGERRKLMNDYSAAASKKPDSRPLAEIGKDIEKFKTKENTTRDFLKTVYNKKIKNQIEQKSESTQRKISDSIQRAHHGKPADKGIVRSILRKKQVLMMDSLGRLYGTINHFDPVLIHDKDSDMKSKNSNENNDSKGNVSFSDIILLILFMTGAVGLYVFVFKRKSLHVGGNNVPSWIKGILIVILVAMLVYLFYPLIKMFGYNWFVWVIIGCVVFLLYRLFSEDQSILKSDDDE